jgi:hypothetical protein
VVINNSLLINISPPPFPAIFCRRKEGGNPGENNLNLTLERPLPKLNN